MNINEMRSFHHVRQDMIQTGKYIGDNDKISDSDAKKIFENKLKSLQVSGILSKTKDNRVDKVEILWNTYTIEEKIKWYLVNKIFKFIAKKKRRLINKKNMLILEDDSSSIFVEYPKIYKAAPKQDILVYMSIKPVQSLESIVCKFEIK